MVMGVLLALMTLLNFIGQQDDIGEGTYDVKGAFIVTFLHLPQQAYELLPIGALIGAIIGLGGLARDSELTILRAAGVSISRIALSAGFAGAHRRSVLVGDRRVLRAAGRPVCAAVQGLQPFLPARDRRQPQRLAAPGRLVHQCAKAGRGKPVRRRVRLPSWTPRGGSRGSAAPRPPPRIPPTDWVLTEVRGDPPRAATAARTRASPPGSAPGAEFNADFLGLAVTEPGSLPLSGPLHLCDST